MKLFPLSNFGCSPNASTEIFINPKLSQLKITIEVPSDWNPTPYPTCDLKDDPFFHPYDPNVKVTDFVAITSDIDDSLNHMLRFVRKNRDPRDFELLKCGPIELKIELLQDALSVSEEITGHLPTFTGLLDECLKAEKRRQEILRQFYLGRTEILKEFAQLSTSIETLFSRLNDALASHYHGYQKLGTTSWSFVEKLRSLPNPFVLSAQEQLEIKQADNKPS